MVGEHGSANLTRTGARISEALAEAALWSHACSRIIPQKICVVARKLCGTVPNGVFVLSFNSQALAEVFTIEHSIAFFHQKAPEKNRGMKYGYNTHSAHHMAISPAAILETSKQIIFRRIDLP
jgi:hypothetical protein